MKNTSFKFIFSLSVLFICSWFSLSAKDGLSGTEQEQVKEYIRQNLVTKYPNYTVSNIRIKQIEETSFHVVSDTLYEIYIDTMSIVARNIPQISSDWYYDTIKISPSSLRIDYGVLNEIRTSINNDGAAVKSAYWYRINDKSIDSLFYTTNYAKANVWVRAIPNKQLMHYDLNVWQYYKCNKTDNKQNRFIYKKRKLNWFSLDYIILKEHTDITSTTKNDTIVNNIKHTVRTTAEYDSIVHYYDTNPNTVSITAYNTITNKVESSHYGILYEFMLNGYIGSDLVYVKKNPIHLVRWEDIFFDIEKHNQLFFKTYLTVMKSSSQRQKGIWELDKK